MVTTKTVIETLKAARAKIALGWTQGVYAQRNAEQSCYCALGAIAEVCGMFPDAEMLGKQTKVYQRTVEELAFEITNPVPCDWAEEESIQAMQETVIAFNDSTGTVQTDVLAVFDSRIADLERK